MAPLGLDGTYCESLSTDQDIKQCEYLLEGYEAVQHFDTSWCSNQADVKKRQICLTALAVEIANRGGDIQYCDKIPQAFDTAKRLCLNLAGRSRSKAMVDAKSHIPQKQQNILLMQNSKGWFEEKSQSMGVSRSFWSWTGKAADLDNDGWQDIYVGNGYEFGTKNNEIHSNVFFHNNGGAGFSREERRFGLEDPVNTSSYSYSDMDLDGDIDIIAPGVMSTPRFFVDQGNKNHSISFDLRDHPGNFFCIGCKVVVHYAGDRHEMRELKLSGGFQPFDNPVAYFGLGGHDQVDRL